MIKRTGDQGFVSLLTAIMISMLLLVITVSLISLEALQLRKAEDSEQSLRAYYTAEAGVEDAVAKVLSGVLTPSSPSGCSSSAIGPTSAAQVWTCQQVSWTGSPSGDLKGPPEEGAVTIDPGHQNTVHSVVIEWNQVNGNPGSYYNPWPAIGCGSCNFPAGTAWNGTYAPPVELQMVEFPDGGFKASDVCAKYSAGPGWQNSAGGACSVKTQNLLLVPGGGAATADVPYGTWAGLGPQRANCATAPRSAPRTSSYNCYAVISGLTSGGTTDYLFRLRSRYVGSQYRMTFWTGANGNGSMVDVPDGMVMIDVTARAGDAYRRVISQLPRGTGAASSLNYVIYSDTDVCKNFNVINDQAQAGCPY